MTRVLAWITATQDGLDRAAHEVLTFAREVAAQALVPLHAVTLDDATTALRDEVATAGAQRLHAVTFAEPIAYAPAAWARAIGEVIETQPMTAVIGPGTARGNEVMAHLAAQRALPMVANVTALARAGDGWDLTRMQWGGMLLEDARLDAPTVIATLAPHQVTAHPLAATGQLDVDEHTVEVLATDLTGVVEAYEPARAGVSLANARVVVAGGRGVGSADGFDVLEQLARLLDGAVGCSRVATNNGWRSHNDQVGQTGTRVAPDLYVACGISGATQHWVGCMHAKHILAINTDPQAPMVTRAHSAVIGDLHEVLAAVIDEIAARR